LEKNPVVSVVDDDASVRSAMSSLLRSQGWETRLYASAEAFLDSGRVDVVCVISDVDMPGMNGLEMQQRLLQDGHALPMIFITAFASPAVRAQALDSGALCFLIKPADSSTILQCLQKLLPEAG
jgi:FixJ family two-component response regulator